MLFNSFEFLIFFPVCVVLFFALAQKWRWLLLLAASYIFYMYWKPEYIILILLSTIVDYISGIYIQRYRDKRLYFLIASLVTNLGLLVYFKYFNFFLESFLIIYDGNSQANFTLPEILLPVGISFYTFQTLSYTIDVYKGNREAESHFGYFALYVTFFPQLVAGPIERSSRLLPQFRKKVVFEYDRIADGTKLMLWGFFKKIAIADRLAIYVNEVYGNVDSYEGFPLIVATYFFAFQIYCDFSGYSDIAIGAAKIFGIDLMDNFKRPYFSKSISEFWKRWHISLSTWFRDYLYIPLGGNRVSRPRLYINLMIVFLVSGLWHGANWTFVVWGMLHGIYMLVEASTKVRIPSTGIMKYVKIFTTFHLVLLAWVFFRAENVVDALRVIQKSISILDATNLGITTGIISRFDFFIDLSSILILIIVHIIERHSNMRDFLNRYPKLFRWSVYQFLLLYMIVFGAFQKEQFIYFQF